MTLCIILVILFVIILLVSCSSVRIKFKYLRKEKNDRIAFEVSIFKEKLSYKIDIPKIRLNKNKSSLEVEAEFEGKNKPPITDKHNDYSMQYLYSQFFRWYPIINDYLPAGNYLLKKITLCKFKWQTELGLQDAAYTGLSVGILWSLKSIILSNIYHYIAKSQKPPDIKVIPRFNKKVLTISIDCIFNVKIGYVMLTGLKCLKIFIWQVINKKFCSMRGEYGGRTTTSN